MKKKIGLGLITLNLTMASILGQLYSSVQKSFTHKSLYTLDVSPVVKTNQNIKKLINTSPIRISDSLKAKVDINTAKIVSSSSINQKIRHKTSVVKINPIKKFIPKYELAAVSSGTIAAVSDLSVKKIKVELKESIELKVTEPVELSAVTVHKSHIKKTKWLASYKPFKYQKFEPVIKRDFKTLSGSSKQSIAKKETFNKSNESKSLNIQNNKKLNYKKLDRISTAQAATEKSNNNSSKILSSRVDNSKKISDDLKSNQVKTKVITQKVKESNNDILFFDYSASETPKTQFKKVVNPSLPPSLTPKKTTSLVKTKNKLKKSPNPFEKDLLASMDSNKVQKDSSVNANLKKINTQTPILAMSGQSGIDKDVIKKLMESSINDKPVKRVGAKSTTHESEYSLTVSGITTNGINKRVSNFEVRFADDRDDIIQDYGSGIIEIRNRLNSTQAIRRGIILSARYVPTVVDFVFENNIVKTNIPLVSRDKLNSIINHSNITGLGGHVLVELDDLTEDVEIEVKNGYEKKIHLSKSFQIVNPTDSEYSYLLFVGVRPGNALLNFRTYKNEFTSKIINVANDQIFFDSNFYIELKSEKIDLFEENLLAKDQLPLNIATNEISSFSFDSKISKKALNRYEINRAVYPLGTRKYQELKHLGESIFIGHWDKSVIDVPSESYMRFILDNFQISNVASHCLVQLNLSKSAKYLSYEGDSGNGPMRINQLLLDKDGIFYDEFGHNTHKIFLLGERQGVINIKVEYADESIDYVQTFCSDSTYLIEQL